MCEPVGKVVLVPHIQRSVLFASRTHNLLWIERRTVIDTWICRQEVFPAGGRASKVGGPFNERCKEFRPEGRMV